jgi:hypothetical protein
LVALVLLVADILKVFYMALFNAGLFAGLFYAGVWSVFLWLAGSAGGWKGWEVWELVLSPPISPLNAPKKYPCS